MRVSLALIAGLLLLWDPDKHAAIHKHGGYDEVATATPAANAIPKAGSDGKLDAGWLPASQSGGLDSGLIVLSLAACPSGYSEETSLNGKFVLGTLNANGNVTGTGGSDTITSVINHTHTVTVTDPGHTHTLPVGATDDTAAPFDRADAGSNTSGANATTASGSSTTGITATTANPAGGVASIDNRPAFVRVIFCKKD